MDPVIPAFRLCADVRLQACSSFHMVQIKYLIIVSRSPSSKQTGRIVKSQLQKEQDCKVPASHPAGRLEGISQITGDLS